MDVKLLAKSLEEHYHKKLPLVTFSLPESTSVVTLLQKDSQLYTEDSFTTKSVVIAPFDFKDVAYCIPEAHSEIIETELTAGSFPMDEVFIEDTDIDKEQYIQLVSGAIDSINSNKTKKIVVSRKKDVKIKNFQFKTLFSRIFSLYPNAFRYIWYHPEIGLWCGATPEVLVKTENNSFSTMALAGTQKFSEKIPIYWNEKEIEEQQFVVEAITNSLQKVTDILKVSKTYTQQAGSLAHLRTDVTGIIKSGKATLRNISTALHPTPAVCGTPKKEAREFILENEGYDREYYTGFIGPICWENARSSLFVNLRCMKIEDGHASLYVGGGVIAASKTFEEWQETQNKLQTMLQVLQPML